MNSKFIDILDNPHGHLAHLGYRTLENTPVAWTPWLKKKGIHKFSIVSAVFGVEQYLDTFFRSITNQTLDFTAHIELIMVDDGSLDDSASIIKSWQKKYPDNIHYIHKENGGQASARNLGIEHVTNQWVTFIDPDDFINKRYFEVVDHLLTSHQHVALVSCQYMLYNEAENITSDKHALRFRFDKDVSCFTLPDLQNNLQLSVNSAFFDVDIIRQHGLSMDAHIQPNFEDAHFVGKYLLLNDDKCVLFSKQATYFYRKRINDSSTLDTSWQKPQQFTDKLKFGSLSLLEFAAQSHQKIPRYIQRTVLYDLIWYFKRYVNNKAGLAFLGADDSAEFIDLLRSIFNKLESQTIVDFELVDCDHYFKTGWLHLFKHEMPNQYEVRVEAYDRAKKLIKLHYYFSSDLPNEVFSFDHKAVLPVYTKIRDHHFVDELFVHERIIWLPFDENAESFTIDIGNSETRIKLGAELLNASVELKTISDYLHKPAKAENSYSFGLQILRRLARLSALLPDYQDAWILMDRDVQADDNAEHLYRYIQREHPEIKIRFLLRKQSHDWQRLEQDGFNLVKFGSLSHMMYLFNAKHLISSHADNYVVDFPPQNWFKGVLQYHYTFLQHGVTKDDISNWLNSKPIEALITASEREYHSISGQQNNYKFTDKEVCLTGFARHDALLSKAKSQAVESTRKTLLIMPTWRENLVGKKRWMSNDRKENDAFYRSRYALSWKQLLQSKTLRDVAERNDLDVVFFPHANVTPYLEWFDIPSYITSLTHQSDGSIQDLFVSASILLTDYSSVAFEVAYLQKPVIYYQFDSEQVFGGEHLTAKGYFDYREDGFGAVCESEQDVFTELVAILDNDARMSDVYKQRVGQTFTFRDGRCCERIYEAIVDLGL